MTLRVELGATVPETQTTLPKEFPKKGTIFDGKPNQLRHTQNLSMLHGAFYHGIYYHHGEAQKPKKGR